MRQILTNKVQRHC